MSDLNEQADVAIARLFVEYGVTFRDAEQAGAAMLWLDGYRAGMDAVKKIHDAAIASVQVPA